MGVAVAGLGFVGAKAHVPALRKIPEAELIAVIDVDEERARKVASKYGLKYYQDFSKAVRDPEVDAVVVAVPTSFHSKLVSDALANGKHVLCEMPLAAKIEEAEVLMEKANNAGVILMPDLNFRFTPNYVKTKELVEQDRIGKPIAVTFSELIPAKELASQWPSSSWAWDIDKSGGYPDFTLSVWSVDLLRWLLNSEIEDVRWMSNYAPLVGIHDFVGYNTVGIVKFSSGAVGMLHYSATVAQGEGASMLEVFGDKTKRLRASWNNVLTLIEEGSKKEWKFSEKGTKVWGHYQIDAYFINCILQGKKPEISAKDGMEAQKISARITNTCVGSSWKEAT